MSEAALARREAARAERRIRWSFVGDDGQPLMRFSRRLDKEAWLLGMEEAVDPELNAGKWITEPDGSHSERRRWVWPLAIDEADAPIALALIENISEFTPDFPPPDLFERLLLLTKTAPELVGGLMDRDVERIADAVTARLMEALLADD